MKQLREYRINKGGCECFRTRSRRELKAKLDELLTKHPNTTYTIQERAVQVNPYGVPLAFKPNGEPAWSSWS